MSFYEDQEEDWLNNDCKGDPSNYDGAGNFEPSLMGPPFPPKRTKSEKRNAQRRRAKLRNKQQAETGKEEPRV